MISSAIASLFLLATLAICETASLDVSKKGVSLDLQTEEPYRDIDDILPERKRRPKDYPEDEFVYERHGRNGKKKRGFSLNLKSDHRKTNDEERESIVDCDDLFCSLEYILKYLINTVVYPLKGKDD